MIFLVETKNIWQNSVPIIDETVSNFFSLSKDVYKKPTIVRECFVSEIRNKARCLLLTSI